LWKDRFRNLLSDTAPGNGRPAKAPSSRRNLPGSAPAKGSLAPFTRNSSGTDQFFRAIHTEDPLSILDLTGASQANISFLTGLGHRLSSDDILATMDQCFGSDEWLENQQVEGKIKKFLELSLNFPEQQFDAALVWDTLQFMVSPLLEQTIERLLRVMKPGGLILAFFSSEEKVSQMPVYSYRIQDPKTLLLIPRGDSRQIQYFHNRTLERLFAQAQSVKFFLSRDHLREVIVRR
jgi:hypothetical protein